MKGFRVWLLTLIFTAGTMAAGSALAQPAATAPAPAAGATATSPAPASGAMAEESAAPLTAEQRLEALEQRQKIVERQMELDREAAETKAKSTPVVTAGKDGFALSAADGSARIKFRGLIQVDGRFYVDDQPEAYQNTFLLRRARPIIEGTLWKYYDFRFMPDFGEGKAVIQDLYIDARFLPEFDVQVGKFKVPVGLERLQSISDLTFVEFSLPTSLTPNRDVGVMVNGAYLKNFFTYSFGVFDGVPDGASADRNADGMFDYAGRVFVRPFKNRLFKDEALGGLGIGIGASSGLHYGTATSPEVGSYKSAGQTTFFKYITNTKTPAKTVVADGLLNRYSPQFYYYFGPFGLTGEYVSSEQRVRVEAKEEVLTNTAWQVTTSFVITGEDVTYKSVKPRKPFDPANKSWGAWEIAGRYSELTVDEDAFPLYADPDVSAGRAHSWGAGVNGYLNNNVKVMFDYDETSFVGGGQGRSLPTERVYFSRFQVNF